jgi:hypothetical protein
MMEVLRWRLLIESLRELLLWAEVFGRWVGSIGVEDRAFLYPTQGQEEDEQEKIVEKEEEEDQEEQPVVDET